MRRPVFLAALAAVAAFAGYALWPLGDERFAIPADEAAARAKQAFLAAPAVRRSDLPNVVLIVADDLGKHDVSVYSPASVETPNLERLARQGVTFSAGYVTAPVCSPSRAGLLTGRQQQRFGFELLTHDRYPRSRLEAWVAKNFFSSHGWFAVDPPQVPMRRDIERQGLPPGEITVAELLRKAGYATGIFGKWHLGWSEAAIPQQHGFDHQYGFYDAFSLYADPDDPSYVGVKGDYFADRWQWWTGRSGHCAIRRNGEVIDETGYLTDRIAGEASKWISAHRERPFFAYVPFNAPHAPLQAPRAYVERFASEPNPDRRVYLAMIAALDDAVGKVLAALDDAGVSENTLVIFTSDNGAATYTGIASNEPLRGGKLTNFEGGLNVPLALRWPARVPPGARYREPVSTLDVFATITRAAGVELPSDRSYDGADLLPYLLGERSGPPHGALFWRTGGHRGIRTGDWKLISDARTGSRVLFDLARDPSEANDVSASQPEVAEAMEAQLRAWEATLATPLWPNVMEYRFQQDGRDFVFPL